MRRSVPNGRRVNRRAADLTATRDTMKSFRRRRSVLRKLTSKPRRRNYTSFSRAIPKSPLVTALTRKPSLSRVIRMLVRTWVRQREKFSGIAYVVDGDTVRVAGQSIRLLGIDAPELGQPARDAKGHWYDQGKFVSRRLHNLIGGKYVTVIVVSTDKYRRLVGKIEYEGMDVNAWLVKNGFAIAAYGNDYKLTESMARLAKRGIWSDKESYNPAEWRRRSKYK